MIGRVDRLDFRRRVEHWKAQGLDLSAILLPAGHAGRRRAPLRDAAQDHGLERALDRTTLIPAVPAGHRARQAGRAHAADPQRQPHGRHDARLRDHHALRRRRACRTTRSASTSRGSAGQSFGAFVPRGITLHARGRRQRLLRQGALGRQAHRLPAAAGHLRARGEHRHRQRRALRRHRRRGLRPRRRRRALRRAQQRRARGRRGHRRPRLRVHDRRPRGRARPDRPQLRGRHDRRHRLRARRRRRLQAALQPGHGRPRAARRRPRTSSWCAT